MPETDLEWAVREWKERSPGVRLNKDYFKGKHRLLFDRDAVTSTFLELFQRYRENLCKPVVKAFVNRVQVAGWECSGDEALAQRAQDIWEANQMDKRAGEVNRDAFSTGDGYVLVWRDQQAKVHMTPQDPETIVVRYSEADPAAMEVGAKVWKRTEDNRYRVNLYYPTHTERWITLSNHPNGIPDKQGRWVEFDEDQTGFQIENSPPICPLFHFGFDADTGDYGVGVLEDVIPLQDGLNKTLVDRITAMEYHALPLRYALGIEVQFDSEGRKIDPFKGMKPGQWIASGNHEAQVGQLEPGSMAGFLTSATEARNAVARVAGLPPYELLLEGGPADTSSGEARKTAEGRLVKAVTDYSRDSGEVWEQATALAVAMDGGGLDADLTVLWEPPGSRAEKEFWETGAMKHDLGVPKNQVLLEGGYTQEQVDQWEEDREAVAGDTGDFAAMQQAAGLAGMTAAQGYGRGLAVPAVQVSGEGE